MVKKLVGVTVAASALALSAFAFAPESGLKVGEMVSAFHPKHVSGPHKGTDACPPCTYGNRPQVQVWVNGDNPENVAKIAKRLNAAVNAKKSKELKAFVIVLTDSDKVNETKLAIETIAGKTNANDVAMAYLPKGDEAVKAYKVSTASDVKNTVFVYRNRKVDAKMVNLKADEKGLQALDAAVENITK